MLSAMGLIYGLFNLDVVLAKHFLPASAAGDYAVISLAGRVVLYLTSSVGAVILSSANGSISGTLLTKGLGVVLGASVAMELVYVAFSKPLISVAFGAQYSAASLWLPVLGAGMVALAGSNLTVYFLLAMRRVGFLAVLALSLSAELALITWHHHGPGDIAMAFTVAAAASFVAIGALALQALRRTRLEAM